MTKTCSTIQFTAKLQRPASVSKEDTWTFLCLPKDASDQLSSRGMMSVEGTINAFSFQATLEPDGLGGHWLKVEQELREAAGAVIGDQIKLEISPMLEEPEPAVPGDLREALEKATPKARETWSAITAIARRDWIFWIVSGKKAETRVKRLR